MKYRNVDLHKKINFVL